ncbi:MAG: hypothetical protein IPM18_11895 [Phycisphaerales bacterium]|nr:hypothetical protein [Phycisphaerales bacterium]
MSAIPPGWLGSIAQIQGAQQRAAADKSRTDAAQADRVSGGSFADKLQDIIEASDRDAQVFADAEGSGSQGRPADDEAEEHTPRAADETRGAEPAGGAIDLTA